MAITGRATSRGEHDPAYVGLLTRLMTNTLDEDYQTVAAQRGSAPRRGKHAGLVAGIAVFGVLIGTAALNAREARPIVALERTELVQQIHSRQGRLDAQQHLLSTLRGDVKDLQRSLTGSLKAGTLARDRLTRLGMSAGTAAITGPGVRINIDDSTDPLSGEQQGVIRDTDIQALVNGLWSAGAEGIAIDGHRLTSLSAIRFAGRAITVDYRSLTPPYVVDVIGNPNTLPARLSETAGGQLWSGLRINFGVTYDTVTRDRITLAANPREHLLYAQAAGDR